MKKKLRGIVKNAKRLAVLGLAGCLLYGASGQASATVLKDVFDEKYYADNNEDVKKALGDDKEALWNHYITYGLSEGRSMNYFFDVKKYRAMYSDLDKAFGDDWDAYLNHFLTFGVTEKRNPGTTFDALAYAARYPDLKALFGNDIVALWNHYKSVGVQEGRNAKAEAVVATEKKAEEKAQTLENYNATASKEVWYKDWDGTDLKGDSILNEWDKDGRLVKTTYYYGKSGIDVNDAGEEYEYSKGQVKYSIVYEYGLDARLAKITRYGWKKKLIAWNVYSYDDKNKTYTVNRYEPEETYDKTVGGTTTIYQTRQENVRQTTTYSNLNAWKTDTTYTYKYIYKDVVVNGTKIERQTAIETNIMAGKVVRNKDGLTYNYTYEENGNVSRYAGLTNGYEVQYYDAKTGNTTLSVYEYYDDNTRARKDRLVKMVVSNKYDVATYEMVRVYKNDGTGRYMETIIERKGNGDVTSSQTSYRVVLADGSEQVSSEADYKKSTEEYKASTSGSNAGTGSSSGSNAGK